MKQLQISKTLSLPADAITQALAFIGRRGSGKSYAATKLAELLASIGGQFIAIDPVGIWYSLRLAKDGKNKGLDIVIFGGLNGDLPIESTGGTLIADIIADRNISAVIDVSQFESDADKTRFARDFASRFFFRKKASPSAVHIFLEEAQEFIPQNIQRGEEKMLHDWQRMIRLGRNYGIGVSMISQRPQDINKKALNQAECVFAFQLTGTHEREAVKAWISDKGLKEDLFHTLTTLETGHAHVWSPAWLRISEEIMIAPKETFAAGSTPKLGDKPITVKALAPIELEKLKEDMKATIAKIKADDPKELKKQIAELKKEKSKLEGSKPNAQPDPKGVQKLIDRAVTLAVGESKKEMNALANTLQSVFGKLQRQAKVLNDVVEESLNCLNKWNGLRSKSGSINGADILKIANLSTEHVQKSPERIQNRQERIQNSENRDQNLGKCERAILAVLATRSGKRTTKTQAAILSGYSSSSGGFNNSLGKLRSSGYIEGGGDDMKITELGFNAVGDYEEMPTGEALWDYWKKKLGKCEREILSALIAVHPNGYTKDALGEVTRYSASSGGFNNSLGKLRTLELINRDKEIKASDSLFE